MIIIRDTREPDPDGGAWRFPGISVPFVWAGSREGAEAFALASFKNYRRLLAKRLAAVQSEP
jgi:hypothetical protein